MLMNPYLYGGLALVAMYLLSWYFTGSPLPFALAAGKNGNASTSVLQFLIFTALTIFAYITIVAARVLNPEPGVPFGALPSIPVNLLILMGLSITTATSSKAITISYLQQQKVTPQDDSTLVKNRDGDTDLIKVQMLIWTLVTAAIYLVQLDQFLVTRAYAHVSSALPDVDGALLALMGASQGGYVAGKLVSRTVSMARLDHVLPNRARPGAQVSILGNFFGDDKAGNTILLKDPASSNEAEIPIDKILEWTDTKIRFELPATFAPQKWLLTVIANGQAGESQPFEITAG